MLLLMMSRPTALYCGITIGRATPRFVRTMCDPRLRSSWNPSASKTLTSSRQLSGVSLRDTLLPQGEFNPERTLRRRRFTSDRFEPGVLQDLDQRAALEAGQHKQVQCFVEILNGLLLRPALAEDIE